MAGGLTTWEDGINFMMWATLVTACTVMMWEGFGVIKDIVDGMERYMNDSGYSSGRILSGCLSAFETSKRTTACTWKGGDR